QSRQDRVSRPLQSLSPAEPCAFPRLALGAPRVAHRRGTQRGLHLVSRGRIATAPEYPRRSTEYFHPIFVPESLSAFRCPSLPSVRPSSLRVPADAREFSTPLRDSPDTRPHLGTPLLEDRPRASAGFEVEPFSRSGTEAAPELGRHPISSGWRKLENLARL